MYKSKLISMMRTLSSRELGRFESYIQSPFFNKNEVVLALYEYVSKYHPDYSHKNLNKDNVVKVLFPNPDSVCGTGSPFAYSHFHIFLVHMQPALFPGCIFPPPSAGSEIFSRPNGPGTGCAADAYKAPVV